MTTVRDVVALALRQAKVIAPGEDASSDEAADGLTAFQSMLDMMVDAGLFGRLNDTYQTSDYTAEEGDRVIAPAGVTVTIPDTIETCGETRAPRDLSIIETVIGGTRGVKVYDRTGWVSLLGLTLSSDAPFAGRGVAGLSACLARTYVEMFGGELGPYTQRMAARFEGSLSRKGSSTQDKQAVEYF